MLLWGLIASRFLHYLSGSILFGAALFPVYAARGVGAAARFPWLRFMLLAAAVTAIVSGATWFLFTAATMSGDWAGMLDAKVISLVLRETSFGRIWSIRLLLAGAAFLLILPRAFSAWRLYSLIIVSLVLVASISGTGHGPSGNGANGLWHQIADAIHLVTAAMWVGALFGFSVLAAVSIRARHDEEAKLAFHALKRFSGIGTFLVAFLLASGAVNTWFLVGTANVFAWTATNYGQVLLFKLALVALMLALAALNRFQLTPALGAALGTGASLESQIRALRLSLLAETGFGMVVLLAVAWLGTLAPPAPG